MGQGISVIELIPFVVQQKLLYPPPALPPTPAKVNGAKAHVSGLLLFSPKRKTFPPSCQMISSCTSLARTGLYGPSSVREVGRVSSSSCSSG